MVLGIVLQTTFQSILITDSGEKLKNFQKVMDKQQEPFMLNCIQYTE
jgi:hypothetical protein